MTKVTEVRQKSPKSPHDHNVSDHNVSDHNEQIEKNLLQCSFTFLTSQKNHLLL